MKLKLLPIFMFPYFISFAQLGFEHHIINSDENHVERPLSIYAVDLDSDGDLDVISTSDEPSGSDKVLWYENIDGQGTFGHQIIINTDAENPEAVYVGDIDGDGDIDVLAGRGEDASVVWYENLDGQANFGNQQIILPGSLNPVSLKTTDLDGDSDLDVLVCSYYQVIWLENLDGQGNFGFSQLINDEIDDITSIHASDIDGDGDLDVLSTSTDSNDSEYLVAWYENIDGQGDFGPMQIISELVIGPRSVNSADLDGDGDQDVFVGYAFGSTPLVWFENTDGQGNFSDENIILTNDEAIWSVYPADFDDDGDIDILSIEDAVVWFENTDGQGNFGVKQLISADASNGSVYASDIDGDGDMDALSSSPDDRLAWYENTDGLGTFGIQQVIAANVNKPTTIFSADIDGDNDMDLLTANNEGNNIVWYENLDGQGAYSSLKVITSNAFGAHAVSAADFDGDGDLDVISTSFSQNDIDNELAWHENLDGQGNFGPPQIIETNFEGSLRIDVTDIDSDGDMDVVATYFHEGKVVWFKNTDGQGNFSSALWIEFSVNFYPGLILASDIDSDGDMDVVYSEQNRISWAENLDGQGSFNDPQNIVTGTSVKAIRSADIDGDGDMDLVFAALSNKLIWIENLDGQGNFGPFRYIATNSVGINSLSITDFDGDGDLDVISGGNSLPNSIVEVTWYENTDGHGFFSSPQAIATYPSVADVRSIITTDVDNDSDMDVVSASYFLISNDEGVYNTVAWHENLGLISNKIRGKVKLDLDVNGCDNSDLPVHNVMISTNDGMESMATFTLHNGYYQFFPDEGIFVTSVNIPNYYNVIPASLTSNFVGIGNTETADFCLEPNQTANNLTISLYPLQDARPGFIVKYQLVFQNMGTTQLSGEIVLEFDDSKLEFLNASETVTSQVGNMINFNYSTLNQFETRTIDVEFNVFTPPIVNINDTLSFTASINPIAGDYSENDNVFSFDQLVIGSFDPNDILVLEGDKIRIEDVDNYLHYIIRFQNTGTAEAFNVRVDNLLDENLNWESLQMESTSHTYRVEIENGNAVSFIFDNINLPDSTSDEVNSHGFIAYKIKPKSNIAVGSIISNKADIFFDFNPAIETNTVTTEIISISSIDEFATLNFTIYPIPTEGILSIKSSEEIVRIEIYDGLGQLIMANSGENIIDISAINRGFYFCKVLGNNGAFGIEKIIKN